MAVATWTAPIAISVFCCDPSCLEAPPGCNFHLLLRLVLLGASPGVVVVVMVAVVVAIDLSLTRDVRNTARNERRLQDNWWLQLRRVIAWDSGKT